MILDRYLQQLQQIHATGEAVPETSYYPAIAALLNEIGTALNPRVSCVINLKNRGAGIPDGGFFTENQLRALSKREGEAARDNPFPVQMPERGVLEVKGVHEDVETLARSAQVAKYLARYGQVLVTNLREWLLVTRDPNGNAVLGERWALAPESV